jgi:hypothetical protein
MPRPTINLEPYREEISSLYQTGSNIASIIEILSNQYDLRISERTLRARLSGWGIQKYNHAVMKDTVLHARIKVLMYQVGLNEVEIIDVLNREGFKLSPRTYKYVRHQLGLLQFTTNPILEQQQVEKVLEKLRTEISNGQLEGYGRRMLYHHFRSNGFQIARYVHIYI